MKEVELCLWWSGGKLDSDGYESDYSVSDEEYNTIVNLVRQYANENCNEEDGIYVDPQEFTEEYFYKNANASGKDAEDNPVGIKESDGKISFICNFLTNCKESATTVYVDNEYFERGSSLYGRGVPFFRRT